MVSVREWNLRRFWPENGLPVLVFPRLVAGRQVEATGSHKSSIPKLILNCRLRPKCNWALYRLFGSIVHSIEFKIAILIDNHDIRSQWMRYIGIRHQTKGSQRTREIFGRYELVWGRIFREINHESLSPVLRVSDTVSDDWPDSSFPFALVRVVYLLLAMVNWQLKNALTLSFNLLMWS